MELFRVLVELSCNLKLTGGLTQLNVKLRTYFTAYRRATEMGQKCMFVDEYVSVFRLI